MGARDDQCLTPPENPPFKLGWRTRTPSGSEIYLSVHGAGAAGNNLAWSFEDVEFAKPLDPGAATTRKDVSEAPKDGEPQKRAQWEKEADGLVEVRMSVITLTYADGTTEVQHVKRTE